MDHFNFDNISHDFCQFGSSFHDIFNNLVHNVSTDVNTNLNQIDFTHTQNFDQHLFDQQNITTQQPYDHNIYNNIPSYGFLDCNASLKK